MFGILLYSSWVMVKTKAQGSGVLHSLEIFLIWNKSTLQNSQNKSWPRYCTAIDQKDRTTNTLSLKLISTAFPRYSYYISLYINIIPICFREGFNASLASQKMPVFLPFFSPASLLIHRVFKILKFKSLDLKVYNFTKFTQS